MVDRSGDMADSYVSTKLALIGSVQKKKKKKDNECRHQDNSSAATVKHS